MPRHGSGIFASAFAPAVAAGGGAWSPLDLPNLYAWYDFTDSGALTITSGNIDAALDKGPNNYDITNTGSNRPTVVTASINGYDTAAFNMSQCLIHATKSLWRFHNANTELSVILGAKVTTTTGGWDPQGYLGTSTGPSTTAGWRMIHSRTAGTCFAHVGDGSSNIARTTHGAWPGLNTWHVWTMLLDPDNGTASLRAQIAYNGGALTTNNADTTSPPSGQDGNQNFAVGGYGASGSTGAPSGGYGGELTHVIMCSSKLGTSDWQAARDFVNAEITAF